MLNVNRSSGFTLIECRVDVFINNEHLQSYYRLDGREGHNGTIKSEMGNVMMFSLCRRC